mgnify:CR=1 FL=1
MRFSILILLFFLAIAFFSLGRLIYFYDPTKLYTPKKIEISYEFLKKPEEIKKDFEAEKKFGKIGIDLSHRNDFTAEEFSYFISTIFKANKSIAFIKENFIEEIKNLTSLIIFTPKQSYGKDEIEAIKNFSKLKKVLIFSEPDEKITNELILNFGLIVEPGYLYNLKENEINFRNIYIKNFLRDNSSENLTQGIEKLLFSVACPIKPIDFGIAFIDENTFSSEKLFWERGATISKKENVLVICDTSFLNDKYYYYADNNKFLINIINWLK